MILNRFRLTSAAAIFATIAAIAPAAAQQSTESPAGPEVQTPAEASVFDGDHITIGAGAVAGPSYEGSDDYVFSPAPALQGKVGGIGLSPRPAGLALDLIDDPRDAKVSFALGPVGRLRFDRNRQIKDDIVKRLGKRDVAAELGGTAAVSFNQLTNPYDSLTFAVDVRWDVAGTHEGMVVAPSITFQTPLSRAAFAALTISAEHVDDKYARYYFSISPAQGAAAGLGAYEARRGWKNAGVGLFGGYDLDGDLTNGGFGLFAGTGYSRVLGNMARSPIVADRGSRDQFYGVLGIGYTF